MSVGELSSLLERLSSVLLLPPSLSAFWLSVSDMASALHTANTAVINQLIDTVRLETPAVRYG